MAYWRMRLFGVCFALLVLSHVCCAGSKIDVRFNSDDRTLIPELVFTDSLIENYDFNQAGDSLLEMVEYYNNQTQSDAKLMVLYTRLGYTAAADGFYDSARTYYRQAEPLIIERQGKQSRHYAELLLHKGEVEELCGNDSTAKEFYEKSLGVFEQLESGNQSNLILPLHRLCQSMIYLNELDSFYVLLQRTTGIIQDTEETEPFLLYENMFLWGDYYMVAETYDSSDVYFTKASQIAKEHLGVLQQAACHLDWANSYLYRQIISTADSLSEELLQSVESVYRKDHPQIGNFLCGRGSIMISSHQFARTMQILNRAEEIILKSVGTTHQNYGHILSHKAILYGNMRDYDKAIEYNERHREYSLLKYGKNSTGYISSVGTLSSIYLTLFNYEAAIPLIIEYSDYYRTHDGEKSYYYLSVMGYLAYAYYLSEDYATAESIFVNTLPAVEEVYGVDNEKTGEVNYLLGMTYFAHGKTDLAEQAFLRCLAIYQRHMNSINPEISGVCSFLAGLYARSGDYEQSLKYFKMTMEKRYLFLSAAYAYSSADQKIRYLSTHPVVMHSLYSMAMRSNNDDAKEFAFEMLMRGKSLALEVITSENQLAHCTDDEEIKAIYESLKEKSSEIAELTYAVPGEQEQDVYKQTLDSLFDVKNELEGRLSGLCEVTAREVMNRSLTIDKLTPHIPDNAVLLEFAEYDTYDLDRNDATHLLFGETNYLVFVLNKDLELEMFDLGRKAEIDSAIQELITFVEQVPSNIYSEQGKVYENQVKKLAANLYDRLVAPYYKSIESFDQWIISGDGGLNLLPFELLVLPDSQYVIEKYTLSYLSTSRDLMHYSEAKGKKPQSMALYFNPNFNTTPSDIAVQVADVGAQENSSAGSEETMQLRGAADCLTSQFSALARTQDEAAGICSNVNGELALDVTQYTGDNASESSLKWKLHTADIYHFATHGFVCPDQDQADIHNLLLYSGLALAGANSKIHSPQDVHQNKDDGILTAFEVSGLDFGGVDLVTLSACETGLGETIMSEGVFGLRRAFQAAGAESLLMSLRKMPDKQCAVLMTDFYHYWLVENMTKKQAIRQATLKAIRDTRQEIGNSHPFFWSGFVLLGNPN